MPTPTDKDTRERFLKRCIPILIREGRLQDQAVAICNSMWANRNNKKSIKWLDILDKKSE